MCLCLLAWHALVRSRYYRPIEQYSHTHKLMNTHKKKTLALVRASHKAGSKLNFIARQRCMIRFSLVSSSPCAGRNSNDKSNRNNNNANNNNHHHRRHRRHLMPLLVFRGPASGESAQFEYHPGGSVSAPCTLSGCLFMPLVCYCLTSSDGPLCQWPF